MQSLRAFVTTELKKNEELFLKLLWPRPNPLPYRIALGVFATAYWFIHHYPISIGLNLAVSFLVLSPTLWLGACLVGAALSDRSPDDTRLPTEVRVIAVLGVVWFATMYLPPWHF